MPQSDREKVKSLNREIDELETKAKDLQELDGIRSKTSGRIRDLSAPIRPTLPGGLPTNVTFARQKSLGEQFVESAEYKELVDSGRSSPTTPASRPRPSGRRSRHQAT